MNTPSHLIITAAIQKRMRGGSILKSAVLWGSVAPDIPLYLLTLGSWIHLCWIRGWEPGLAFRYMFEIQFFRDPVWIVSHNVLHSPTVLGLGLGLIWRLRHRIPKVAAWLFWFLMACLLHTLIDIPVHVDDGPLLFFPFEWTIRFRSAISYWDPRYYGVQFAIVELGLNLILVIDLFGVQIGKAIGWLMGRGWSRLVGLRGDEILYSNVLWMKERKR